MPTKDRLLYLDWMRGLAVVLMIETHVFDSFLAFQYRSSESYWLSQYLGGMPAPMFLFLAGVSLALVLDRLREKQTSWLVILEKVVRRGGWILLLAYAFRFEQAAVWYPYSHWDGVWKVDILNCIAVSSLAVGLAAMWLKDRRWNAVLMGVVAAGIVVMTPFVFLVKRGLPSFVLNYLNGTVHWEQFMFFSWAGFTFAGAAIGYLLLEARKAGDERKFMTWVGGLGALSFWIGYWVNVYPGISYGLYDYSLTSPQYFLVRLGYMLILLYASYWWSRRKGANRWSPVLVFGQTSLLIYWVHIEFVYGRLRMFRNTLGIGATAAQLIWLVPLMLGLGWWRVSWKKEKGGASRSISGSSANRSASPGIY